MAFAALADPTRQRIVEMLAHQPLSSGEIAGHFTASAPAISQHLKVLRDSGLVRVHREAQRRIYAVNPQGLDEMARWIENIRHFWSERLDALEAQLQEELDDERSKTG